MENYYSSALQELQETITPMISNKAALVMRELVPLLIQNSHEEEVSGEYLKTLHILLKGFIEDLKNVCSIETSKFFMEKLVDAFPHHRDIILDNIEDFIPPLPMKDIFIVEEFLIQEIMDKCESIKSHGVGGIFTPNFMKALEQTVPKDKFEGSSFPLLVGGVNSIMGQVSLLIGFLFIKDLEDLSTKMVSGINKYGLELE